MEGRVRRNKRGDGTAFRKGDVVLEDVCKGSVSVWAFEGGSGELRNDKRKGSD
jgi:hypothetical protein